MTNPFAGYGTTVQGERLVGRESEIGLITDRLAAGRGSVSVVGLPRVGKTSLVSEVLARVPSVNPASALVRLNAATIPGGAALLAAMMDEAVSAAVVLNPSVGTEVAGIQALPTSSSYEAYRRASRGFEALKRFGFQSVIAIDEFDAVRLYEGAGQCIQQLREIVDERWRTGVCAVFISRRSLRAIEKQIADISTLHGVCEHHMLKPLEHDGLVRLANRARDHLPMDDAAIERVVELTGGHPYLAEMLLCHSVDTGNIERGFVRCRAETYDFYDHLRELLAEDDLFSPLTQFAVGPLWSVRQGALERLLGYGLLRPSGADPGAGYRGWSIHFQDYLEKQSRETPVWELWSRTEQALRSLVEAVYLRQLGEGWLDILAQRNSAVAKLVSDWREKRERERRQFGAQAAENLLSYSYPGELTMLLFKEWGLFEPILRKDRAYWAHRFGLLSTFRAPAAHNREVPRYLVTEAQGYCEEILARVGEAEF